MLHYVRCGFQEVQHIYFFIPPLVMFVHMSFVCHDSTLSPVGMPADLRLFVRGLPGAQDTTVKTKTIKKTLEPEWNEPSLLQWTGPIISLFGRVQAKIDVYGGFLARLMSLDRKDSRTCVLTGALPLTALAWFDHRLGSPLVQRPHGPSVPPPSRCAGNPWPW